MIDIFQAIQCYYYGTISAILVSCCSKCSAVGTLSSFFACLMVEKPFVLDRFVLDRFVLDRFVLDRFVLDRFVLDPFLRTLLTVDSLCLCSCALPSCASSSCAPAPLSGHSGP